MQITILASGSRGDIQPFVALGAGLLRAGHQVLMAAPREFETFIGERGLGYYPLTSDIRQMLAGEEGRRLLESGGNPIKVFRQLARMVEPIAVEFLRDALQACRDADAIVCGSGLMFAGEALIEKHPRPIFYGSLQPLAPSHHEPAFMLPPAPRPLPWLGRLGYNWLTHWLNLQIFWQMFRGSVNRGRREVLDLPPGPWVYPMKQVQQRATFLYCYSERVVPRPPDWPARHSVTGYWFLDRLPGWTPPAGLEEFLAAGPPPVYVGFGSMNERDPTESTALILEALQQSGQRGVLLTGWGGLAAGAVPPDVFVGDAAPHDWLFPRMAAVVHHGGAGTTSAGLRAGVPSILIPFMGDQPFWGRRVRELGVGPAPVPRKRLTAKRLAEALRIAVFDEAIRRQSRELGERLRTEDGVSRAVEIIEREMQQRRG